MKKFTLLVLAVSACVSLSAHGGSTDAEGLGAWEGKVYVYANPFAGGTIEGPSGWDLDAGRPLTRIIDRRSERLVHGRVHKSNAAEGEVALIVAKASPFQVGTIVAVQEVNGGFVGDMPFTLRLGNRGVGGEMTWSGVAHSDPGVRGRTTFSVSSLDAVGTCDAFQLAVTSAWYGGPGTGYADVSEVIVLPDRLAVLTGVQSSASMKHWGSDTTLTDLQTSTGDGWSTTASTARLTFDFTEESSVDAIIFWSFPNHPMTVKILRVDGAGNETEVALVTLDTRGETFGYTLPVGFDKSIETGRIVMELTDLGSSGVGLRHVMFLTAVPEPATMTLLALGGLAMLRRKVRR